MKKFFAVVLGLALVLGLASVASAELTASGTLVLTWVDDLANEKIITDLHGDTAFSLKLSNSWDNASASLTLAFDEAASDPDFGVDGYEFAYAFSDQFTLKAAKSFEVKTPIFDDAAKAAANIANDPAIGDEVALIGEFTLDGGWVKIATNADLNDLDLAAAAEFVFDPVTVGGVVDLDASTEVTMFGIYAKYALTEEITLTADMNFNDPDNDLALKAAYAGDPFTAAATIKYDIDGDAGLYSWKLEGSYKIADATTASVWFDDTDAYELKVAHIINEGPEFSVAYSSAETLTAKISASF